MSLWSGSLKNVIKQKRFKTFVIVLYLKETLKMNLQKSNGLVPDVD